jgi:hypothetical protein
VRLLSESRKTFRSVLRNLKLRSAFACECKVAAGAKMFYPVLPVVVCVCCCTKLQLQNNSFCDVYSRFTVNPPSEYQIDGIGECRGRTYAANRSTRFLLSFAYLSSRSQKWLLLLASLCGSSEGTLTNRPACGSREHFLSALPLRMNLEEEGLRLGMLVQ